MSNASPNLPPRSLSPIRERLAFDAEITAYIHAISVRHRPSHAEDEQAPEPAGTD